MSLRGQRRALVLEYSILPTIPSFPISLHSCTSFSHDPSLSKYNMVKTDSGKYSWSKWEDERLPGLRGLERAPSLAGVERRTSGPFLYCHLTPVYAVACTPCQRRLLFSEAVPRWRSCSSARLPCSARTRLLTRRCPWQRLPAVLPWRLILEFCKFPCLFRRFLDFKWQQIITLKRLTCS